jgi:hypothetical protein
MVMVHFLLQLAGSCLRSKTSRAPLSTTQLCIHVIIRYVMERPESNDLHSYSLCIIPPSYSVPHSLADFLKIRGHHHPGSTTCYVDIDCTFECCIARIQRCKKAKCPGIPHIDVFPSHTSNYHAHNYVSSEDSVPPQRLVLVHSLALAL